MAALGWNIESDAHIGGEGGWHAWLPREARKTPTDCACNDRPPAITLKPASLKLKSRELVRVSISLVGQLPSGRWVDFTIYGIAPESVPDMAQASVAALLKAWESAAGSPSAQEAEVPRLWAIKHSETGAYHSPLCSASSAPAIYTTLGKANGRLKQLHKRHRGEAWRVVEWSISENAVATK